MKSNQPPAHRLKTIINPTENWTNVRSALDALQTAFQLGCPLAKTFRLLFLAVEEAATQQNAGTVFMIQLIDGNVETSQQATERLWRLGCKLGVRGMGQARRELEAVGCNPETPEERQARFAQHEAYEAEKQRKRLAQEAAKAQKPEPKPPVAKAAKEVTVVRKRMTVAEWNHYCQLPQGNEREAILLELAFGTLVAPTAKEIAAWDNRNPNSPAAVKPQVKKETAPERKDESSVEEQMADAFNTILDVAEKRRKRKQRRNKAATEAEAETPEPDPQPVAHVDGAQAAV